MAMILCPECGNEVSDKAKKCIHCGKVLIEEVQTQKFCGECGKNIPIDAQECPYCGCPVEAEKSPNVVIAQLSGKTKKNRKLITVIAVVAVIIIAIALAVKFAGSTLNADEQLAYQNAVTMKNMMKDPDSFKLYDEMFLLKWLDDDGSVEYTYTVFKYGGANSYGGIETDEAIFKDEKYIMDYADEPDKESPNYGDQAKAKATVGFVVSDPDFWSDSCRMVNIDVEKIKNKMGLE